MKIADYRKEKILAAFEGREITIKATATEFSRDGKTIVTFKDKGKTCKMYLVIKDRTELYPGDIVKVTVTPRRPYTSKVSLSDFSTYLASKRVYMLGYTEKVRVIGRQKDGITGMVYSIRRYVDEIGEKAFSGDNRALFNAMVLGDKGLMSPELSASLRAAGLNHIAVVSGMHLSVMVTALMFILGYIAGNRRRTKIILSVCAVAVTLLTGAGSSVIRACIMCIICRGAFVLSRENDALSGLCVTVFVMLAINPYAVFDVGFVLSVLSVLGILLFSEPVTNIISKHIGGLAGETISVSISTQFTVLPALMLFLGTISLYGLLANLLVTVFVSVLVTVGMIFPLLAKIPVISSAMIFVINGCCNVIISVCEFTQKLPGALADTTGTGKDFFIIWIFMLVVFSLKKNSIKYIPTIFLCFAIALTGVYVYYINDSRKIKIDFASYGKHSMTVTDFPGGPFVLLNCPNYSDAINLVEEYGRRSYSYTVITQKPEYSNVGSLAAGSASGSVIASSEMFTWDEKQALIQELKSYDTDIIFLERGERFSDKNFTVEFQVFYISDTFVAATDMEYNGINVVSLEDFDAFGLEELKKQKITFSCDYLILPGNLTENGEPYESLSTGRILTNKKSFNVNLL